MAIIFTKNTYPYQHWLTSLIIAPLIIMIQDIISGNNNLNDAAGIFILFIVFGLFFSLPLFVLYLLLFNLLINKTNSLFIVKVVLNLITIGGIFVTIKLIGGTMMTTALAMYYSAALIICSLFYKIKKQNTADT